MSINKLTFLFLFLFLGGKLNFKKHLKTNDLKGGDRTEKQHFGFVCKIKKHINSLKEVWIHT
jgi:hypothetical protein